MEGTDTQPALVHPPTQAALAAGRARAVRNLGIGAGVLVAAVIAFALTGGVPEEGEKAANGFVLLVQVAAFLAVVVAAVVAGTGALALRRASFVERVLATHPWHVVGPYRWRTVKVGPHNARRHEPIVAVARPGLSHPLRARAVGLSPGWHREDEGQGAQVWLAGPVADRYVLGTVDGQGLALAKEPTGLRATELGKHLELLQP